MQGVRRIRVKREKIKEDESGQPLSPVARFCHERRNNLYTIAIIGFDTKINPDVIKANIRFMLKHPRFSSLQVTDDNGVMRWVPTKAVDINNHILAPEVNESPDDNFVGNYISNLTKSTINNSMPMWDFHILNIKTSDAESIAIFRVHHSIGDGLSLMSILLSSSLHQNSAPEALEPVNRARKNVPKHNSRMSELFVKFLSFFIVAWNTMVDMVSYISTPWSSPDTQTPLKGTSSRFNRSYGRRIAYRLVQLDDIKLIKNVMGVTVNDVVVGVIQGGMSRYLNNKYGESNENADEKSNNLPNNIRLRGCMIVNIRSSQQIHEGDKSNWGNKLGHVIFPLTIAIKDDPLDCVRDAKATMDRKKASQEATCTYLMAKFFLPVIGRRVVRAMSRLTLMLSNIPGPREEKAICGYPISFIASSIYGQPIALVIHVTSYRNKMAFAVSVDDDVIPNPSELLDNIVESLNLARNAAIAEQLTKKVGDQRSTLSSHVKLA